VSARLVGESRRARVGQRGQQRLDLRVSAAFAAGVTCFHASLSFSNASVWPCDDLDPRRVERARVEQILDAEVVGRLLQLVGERRSTVNTIGRERSFA
jgi:hypothetical protein